MPAETIHECGCGPCRRDEVHPGREYHRHMNLLLSRLDEQQRRWFLAVESERFGYGADRILFEITGVDEKTIRRGRRELAASLVDRPVDRVRLPGGGRFQVKKNRASKVCRGVARFLREGKHLVALRWRDGPYACTAHAQLVAVIGRSSTGVRRLRWPALVGVLAGALHPDSQRLATVE